MLPADQPNHARHPRILADPQLHALEYLLNDLSAHGLEVQRLPTGQWQWTWHDHTGLADGLGSAIIAALHWYFDLTPSLTPLPIKH